MRMGMIMSLACQGGGARPDHPSDTQIIVPQTLYLYKPRLLVVPLLLIGPPPLSLSPPSPLLYILQALFHVIIMFVLYHKQHYNSALGNHFLHDPALSLAEVVESAQLGGKVAGGVRKQSVFGWWYPPTEENSRGSSGKGMAAVAAASASSPASVYGTPQAGF